MTDFGPTLIAGEPCELEEGSVTVVGHGAHLLTPHLDVEITVDGAVEVAQWQNGDAVEVGRILYLVHFKRFEKFAPGLPVANLVTVGSEDDPEVRRAEAAAAGSEDSTALAGGIIPLA